MFIEQMYINKESNTVLINRKLILTIKAGLTQIQAPGPYFSSMSAFLDLFGTMNAKYMYNHAKMPRKIVKNNIKKAKPKSIPVFASFSPAISELPRNDITVAIIMTTTANPMKISPMN
jgi:hypothetical protein